MQLTRTINLTGRKKIPRNKIHFRMVENADGIIGFDGTIDFSDLDVPSDANVVVQPYYKSSAMWFDCGTVASFELPADTLLTEIDRGGSIQFRVLVVDGKEHLGRIIASAERVPLRGMYDEDEQEALIAVRERDIGHVVWKLELDDGLEKPELVINTKIPGASDLIGDHPMFFSLLLPAVIREIIGTIFIREQEGDGDEDSWQAKWIRFAEDMCGREIPQNRDLEENMAWTEELVSEFSKTHKLCDRLVGRLGDVTNE